MLVGIQFFNLMVREHYPNVNSGIKGAGPQLILSQTASASSSISFTSDIDSTYDKYMFVFVNINPATDDTNFQFNVSDDCVQLGL